ncbi:hypothetical protein [Tunicatimonas pelagia]|uniref:hypothetical protein n=1 Tax=Tunicatimonas pelagia TaxID=931531 RepID=UPI00266579A6|nr:hypothetical protein [Tunicatimonas pelagia]WKN44925.1 hypothetical protein P0M28_08110 [Tunicatimonas pelagia]
MKNAILFVSFLLLSSPVALIAQGVPVMDIAHIAMTVANGQTLNDQLDKLEEQVGISYLIERKVSDIYDLQKDYQEFLKQAETTRELRWADLVSSQAHALSLETHMDAYVPAYENVGTLMQAYATLEGINGALALYQELDGFGADTPLPPSYAALQVMLSDLSVNRGAFDEMAYKKKLQVALSYNEVAEDLLEKAQELGQALLVNERFSMTEGERLASIKQAHDYILQSMDLKLQSDQLVLDVMSEAEQGQAGLLKQYEQQLEREVVAITPLYQY